MSATLKSARAEMGKMSDGLAGIGKAGDATADAMKKTVASLSGNELMAAANRTTVAVAEIGGALKLTKSEQASVNAQVTEAIEKYKALGLTAPQAMVELADATRKADPPTRTLAERLDSLKTNLTAFASGARTVGLGLSAAITAPIVAIGAATIKLGMDAVESENLVSVSFGDMRAAADTWSKELSDKLGLNQFELRKTAGTIFNMTTSMGINRQAAFDMSTGVAKLAADMSSFRNIPMEEALLKIRSGLTGEAEPLKAIGILVDDATIKTFAYAHGIAKQGEELTQQQKVMARWGAILQQTANDQGDLARTLDSPTNQLRLMKTRLEEAATALGVSLMPMVQKAISMISELVPYIQNAAQWFSNLSEPAKTAGVVIAGMLAAVGPGVYVIGGLAGAISNLIPLLKTLSIASAAGNFSGLVTLFGAGGLLAAGGLFVAGAGIAIYNFNKNMNEMEARAKAANEPVKDLSGQLLYTGKQAEAALAGIGPMTAGLTFLGKTINADVKPSLSIFTDELKKAQDEVGNLTTNQKAQISAAEKLGQTTLEISKALGISEGALKLLKYRTTEHEKATKASAEALSEYGSISGDVYDQLSSDTIESLKWDIQLGVSQSRLAKVYHVTSEQIGAVADLLKAETAAGKLAIETEIKLSEAEAKHATELRKLLDQQGIDLLKLAADNYADRIDAQRAYDDEVAKRTMDKFDFEKRQIIQHLADQKLALQQKGGDWKTAFDLDTKVANDAINAIEWKKIEQSINETDENTQYWVEHSKAGWAEVSGSLGQLSNDFTQMAQIAGDTWGGPLKAIGQTVQAIDMVSKGLNQVETAMKSIDQAGFNPQNLTALASGWMAIVTVIVELFKALSDADHAAMQLARHLRDSERMSEEFKTTVKFSDALVDSWENQYVAALHVGDAVQELGGYTQLTADQLQRAAYYLYLLTTTVQLGDAVKAAKVLDDELTKMGEAAVDAGDIVSQTFLDLVERAEKFHGTLKDLNAFLLGQLQAGAKGLNAMFEGLQASATASAQAIARAQRDAAESGAAFVAGVFGEVHRKTDDEINAMVGSFTVTTEHGAALAAAVAADFASMVQRGMSYKDALDALQPSIDILRKALHDSGVEGGASFDFLIEMSRIANDAIMGPLTDAITGANAALKGMHNSGILNQQMFTGLEATAIESYNKIIAGGADSNTALMMMTPTLQTIWELHKDFGYAVDDATQALLDEAEATGAVGDAHRPIAEQMLLATKAIQVAVEALAKAFGVDLVAATQSTVTKMTAAIHTIPTQIDVQVTGHYQAPDIPDSGGGPDANGYSAGGTVYAAAGWNNILPFVPRGTDTVPAMLTPGEMVLTRPQQANMFGTAALEKKMDRLINDMARRDAQFPTLLGRAVRDEVQKVRRGR